MSQRDKDRWFQFGMMVFTLLGIFAYVEFYLTRRPPSVDYTVAVQPPAEATYCPGDVLDYRSVFTVTAPPTVVTITRSLWHREQGVPARDIEDRERVFAVFEGGQVVDPLGDYVVPDVGPGVYQLDVVAHGADRRVAGFSVEFHVGNC